MQFSGTIEEKMYQRQISKIDIGSTVVDPESKSSFCLSDEELKDLLNTDNLSQTSCLTHDMLKCECLCSGRPIRSEIVEKRHCQLGVNESRDSATRMNQLMQWEHFSPPFDQNLLTHSGLSNCSGYIRFIFKNSHRS